MGLYSNVKRMSAMFCTAIVFCTIIMLGLRLTVFSDMAVTVYADTPKSSNSASMQSGEIEGNSDFPYRINSKIYYPKADAKGNVLILNPDTNKYLLSVDIILPDTKDSLYYTGAISPGTSIESAPLSAAGQKLPEGRYECIAEISAVDPETMARVASENKKVTVYIGQKPV